MTNDERELLLETARMLRGTIRRVCMLLERFGIDEEDAMAEAHNRLGELGRRVEEEQRPPKATPDA